MKKLLSIFTLLSGSLMFSTAQAGKVDIDIHLDGHYKHRQVAALVCAFADRPRKCMRRALNNRYDNKHNRRRHHTHSHNRNYRHGHRHHNGHRHDHRHHETRHHYSGRRIDREQTNERRHGNRRVHRENRRDHRRHGHRHASNIELHIKK